MIHKNDVELPCSGFNLDFVPEKFANRTCESESQHVSLSAFIRHNG